MPWRLIQFIVVFAFFLVFAGMNLNDENKCTINFGFKSVEVLVFFPVFISFFLGMLCSLPYIIKWRLKSRNNSSSDLKESKAWRKKKNEAAETQADSSFSDGGPYGVN